MAPTSPSPARRASRLSVLDSLRFVAAFGVVAFHYTGNTPAWDNQHAPGHLERIARIGVYGAMGVPLFFVISGFVILMTAWGRDVPQFVASRIGRLFPAYWAAVCVSLILVFLVWPDALGGHPTKANALLNLTMFQGAYGVHDLDGPYWTLWYEARFYLLIAVFLLIGITRQRILAFAALWPVLGAVAAAAGQNFLTALLMPDYAPYFAGGMLLYVLYRDGHDLGTWLLLGMQTLLALHFAMGYYPSALPTATGEPVSTVVVAAVSFACFGLVALTTLTPLRHVDARWMTTLGALTYPLYLIHENLGIWIIHSLRPHVGPWLAGAVAVASALAAAWLLHRFVEQPLGGRLRAAVVHTLRRSTANAPAADPTPQAAPVPAGTDAGPVVPAGSLPRHTSSGLIRSTASPHDTERRVSAIPTPAVASD